MGVLSSQGIEFQLVANDTILDLFKDEDILLSDNVTGLFDLGIIPADFTRQITLPGSKKNNAFFEHVYDISVQSPDTFATNIKVPCYLDFGGVYLTQGYLQLNKVNVYANKFIDSYEVTIFGAVSSFAREINRNYLTDLSSLSIYNHTSSYDNISASWAGDLFSGSIVYPMADYGSNWQYTQGDLYFGLDDNEGGMNIQDFKPAIKMKLVWDAIFNEAGYTYSSSFINNGGFDNIYLICNRALKYPIYNGVNLEDFGVVKIGAISGSGMTDITIGVANNPVQFPWYNIQSDKSGVIGTNSSYYLPVTSSLQGILNLNINVSCSVNNVPNYLQLHYWPTSSTPTGVGSGYTTLVNFNNFFVQLVQSRTGQINQTFELATKFTTAKLDPGTYYFGISSNEYFATTDPIITMDPGGTTKSYLEIKKVNYAADGRIMEIPLNMPFGTQGIKQIDFLTSIQKKFNLVMYPSKTVRNEFIVESFNNWYNKGRRWDFNKYANLDEKIEVIPANNLAVNELNFGDTLDQDYVAQQFSKEANREYGKAYYTDTENFFSQGKFEVKTVLGNGPLLKITGTGLSGSIAGVNPGVSAVYAGQCQLNASTSYYLLCGNTSRYDVFTVTGTIEPGVVIYADSSGLNPYTGIRSLVRSDYDCSIWDINYTTGEVIGDSGLTCTTFGGCV